MSELSGNPMKGNSNISESAGMLSVNLHQRFGNFQLAVEFRVPLGLIVLFGASGAGKSLTLRGLAGLLHPKEGLVTIDGHLLFESTTNIDLPPQERRIGYVPQHYALFPHLTVAENVRFALPKRSDRVLWSKERANQQARVSELLAVLGLEGLERRYPATLSGGQQQRVALARALAAEPRLLLLDEPFNALDVTVRERLRDTLKQFQRKFAVPIVLVTHDHAEAQQLADTIVVLQRGQVVQVGNAQEIFFTPRTPDIALLVGQRNVFRGQLAIPGEEHSPAPPKALRVGWLQANGTEESANISPVNSQEHAWLPLPANLSFPSPAVGRTFTGCILADEVIAHPWPKAVVSTPTWTARGAVQWKGIVLDAQLHGHAVRLLIRPERAWQPGIDRPSPDGVLELYLSRSRWREIEVDPGQPLLLEIGPEAIHLFEAGACSYEMVADKQM